MELTLSESCCVFVAASLMNRLSFGLEMDKGDEAGRVGNRRYPYNGWCGGLRHLLPLARSGAVV